MELSVVLWVVFFFLMMTASGDVNTLLLSPCDSDVDCFPVRGNCVKVAETCNRGVCTCVAPFVATQNGQCRRGITPWRPCNLQAGDVCIGKNFQCIDGQCQCRPGLFPVGDSCVQMGQVVSSLGSTCSDDSNCLPGMECRPWVSANGNAKPEHLAVTICQCPVTHRVLNNTQCVPRRLGDPCGGSDFDCGLILDAICSPETITCTCPITHQATQTLHNSASLLVVDSYITSWQLIDACRPINGATKRIGQRCTNSLQCQYGHMCARCEPKNLNVPKTCNRPACSSLMCHNQTCPLCTSPEVNNKKITNKASILSTIVVNFTPTTTPVPTSTITTTNLPPSTAFEEEPEHELVTEPEHQEILITSTTQKIVEVQSGVNIALAVTLPLVFLILALAGLGFFVRYAWGRLSWRRRAIKCVEAFETESNSASSGLSVNRHQYNGGGGSGIDPNINAPIMSDISNLQNVSFYGGSNITPDSVYATQASATVLIRELEEELEQAASNSIPSSNNCNKTREFSALTLNYNSSNLVNYRNRQSMLSRSMHHLNQAPSSNLSSRASDITACPRHKYCFNSNTVEEMMSEDDYITGCEALPPRLPYRSKSIRQLGPNNSNLGFNGNSISNNNNDNQQAWTSTGIGSSLVSSRLDLDRRKSLQY